MARTEPGRAIDARRLLHWGDLDARRRGGAARGWILRVVAGAGLAAWVGQNAHAGDLLASRLVVVATIGVFAAVMLGTPFRMYWRHDSPLLARLPVPGGALFDVALIRSVRATVGGLVVVAPAAAAIALVPGVGGELAVRHLALVGAVAVAAALLLPAVALGAGALVAGGKADALVAAVGGGQVQAPPTAWLGMLPGLAAAAVVLAVLAAAGWVAGAPTTAIGSAPAVLGGLVAAAVLALLAARQAAPRVMPLAVREVAALDVQRLAHLEIHPPTAIERAVAARLGARAALIHGKDARLLRRRFPMAFVVGALATLALWIVAGVVPAAPWSWVVGIAVAFTAYGATMARRLVTPPIEQRAIETLPVTAADRARAKTAYLVTWSLVYPLVGAAAIAVRLPDGPLLAAAAVAIPLAGAVIVRRRP